MANKKEIQKITDSYFAICPVGFESQLKAELDSIKIKDLDVRSGGIVFKSLPEKAIELILTSRIASRVLKQLYSFDIKNEKDIYYYSKEIKWKALFSVDQTFKINVNLGLSPDGFKRSKFKNTMYLAQILKDGIVDRFRNDTKGKRPSIDKDSPHYNLFLRISPHDNKHSTKENVVIAVDMAGGLLSNRGYRMKTVSAPLRENIAAALIHKSGLSKKSDSYDFYDPMCGSGTLIIEALLILANITPSFLRISEYLKVDNDDLDIWDFQSHFYFTKSKYIKDNFEKLVAQYSKQNEKGIGFLKQNKIKFYGTDIDSHAIKATSINLSLAGLSEFVYLECRNFLGFIPKGFKGIIVTNPPYGERMGEVEELEKTYYEFGENLKEHFKGTKAYLITSNLALIKKIGLRPTFKEIMHNAKLEARFVCYDLY